jgi:hypothetical protein
VRAVQNTDENSRERLHASLALLPVDATQVDYLLKRLLAASPGELHVLRDALMPHSFALTPKLWTGLESAKLGDASLLPFVGALACYAPNDALWETVGAKVSQALVAVNPVFLGSWVDLLRPVRRSLTGPLATLFQEMSHPETEHTLATNILADYARDDPDRLAELLMVSDPKAFLSLFPIVAKRAEQTLPVFRKATISWNDAPLDPSWTQPDNALVSQIDSAQGMLAERFAFCQTAPLHEFLNTALALRKSGYRPVRCRPYADGKVVRVAAVWTRDRRNWRISSGLTALELGQQDERNKRAQFLPVDVAGYLAIEADGKPTERYAALWVEKSGNDEARMYVGATAIELDDRTYGALSRHNMGDGFRPARTFR